MDKLIALETWGVNMTEVMERFLDDKGLYVDCLNTFVQDTGFDNLTKSLQEKNYEQAFNDVHTLKGVAGNLGLNPLFKSLSTMTEALRAKNYSNLDAQHKDVDQKFAEFKEIMK